MRTLVRTLLNIKASTELFFNLFGISSGQRNNSNAREILNIN